MDKLRARQVAKNRRASIGVAGVFHETNSFSPIKTDIDSFQPEWIESKSDFVERYKNTRTTMGAVIDEETDGNIEVEFGFYTETMPSGTVSDNAARQIIHNIVEAINYEKIEGILLILHGAMVSNSCEDVEGEIIRRVREKAGEEIPIIATLDLHANITDQMVENSNTIIGYKTYPHVDVYERGKEAIKLLRSYTKNDFSPVQVKQESNLTIVPETMLTSSGPMKQLMDKSFEIEKESKVLNVTIAGGFPYSDTKNLGMTFIVTTDGDKQLALKYANSLKDLSWSMRERFKLKSLPPKEAVQQADRHKQGPIILVEGSDNVGGGAPADATHTLRHLKNIDKKSLIVIRDVDGVREAISKGIGQTFESEVGGKSDQLHGKPVRIRGKVTRLFDGKYSHVGAYMTGKKADMGTTAVIETNNITVILTEKRVAPWDIGHVRAVGLEAEDFHIIVVKSALAWQTAFGSIAQEVINVDSPGCCTANLDHLEYNNFEKSIYPFTV